MAHRVRVRLGLGLADTNSPRLALPGKREHADIYEMINGTAQQLGNLVDENGNRLLASKVNTHTAQRRFRHNYRHFQ